MFIDWDEFTGCLVDMWEKSPYTTRYTMKYRECDKALEVRINDNTLVYQFKVGSLDERDRVLDLTRLFMALSCASPGDKIESIREKVAAERQEDKERLEKEDQKDQKRQSRRRKGKYSK
eukprot:151121_1